MNACHCLQLKFLRNPSILCRFWNRKLFTVRETYFGVGYEETGGPKRLLDRTTSPDPITITGRTLLSVSQRFGSTIRPNIDFLSRSERYFSTTHEGFCLSFEEFRALLDSHDIQVIDVREPEEIKMEGQIPNAINIPLKDLSSELALPPHKFEAKYKFDISEPEDTRLVFSCRSGVRSSTALHIALELGFINSRHYGGGYMEWSERMKSKS